MGTLDTVSQVVPAHRIFVNTDQRFDRDGDLDLLVFALAGSAVVHNTGDAFRVSGMSEFGLPETSRSAHWVDVDNDGWLDFFSVHDGLFRQTERRRFEADNVRRRERGQVERPIDEYLLAALEQGLPECSGVALGIDRLLMLAAGVSDIREVLAFDWDRA